MNRDTRFGAYFLPDAVLLYKMDGDGSIVRVGKQAARDIVEWAEDGGRGWVVKHWAWVHPDDTVTILDLSSGLLRVPLEVVRKVARFWEDFREVSGEVS